MSKRSNRLCRSLHAPGALDVLDQEWNTFVEYITSRGSRELENVEPLPYRHVLTNSESTRLRGTLASRWGVCGYWYPLSKVEPHVNVIAFHTDLWERRGGEDVLRLALEERAIGNRFAILEGPSDYGIDRLLVDTTYSGFEAFLTSDFEWLVYSSHESSIALAGWIANVFRLQWPDWAEVTYQGPFLTDDLRGTWRRA